MVDMIFRRKSIKLGDGEDAGPCIVAPRGKKWKARKIYAAGDELRVARIEELPGYPNSMDGWKFVKNVGEAVASKFASVEPASPDVKAKLRAVHHGRDNWKVIIDAPGYDYMEAKSGQLMAAGVKVHPGFVTKEKADEWVRTGSCPME